MEIEKVDKRGWCGKVGQKLLIYQTKRKNLFESQAEWGFSLVEKEKELSSQNRQLLLSSFWIAIFLPRVNARRKRLIKKLSSNNSLILALKFDFSIFQLVRKDPEFGLLLEIYILMTTISLVGNTQLTLSVLTYNTFPLCFCMIVINL